MVEINLKKYEGNNYEEIGEKYVGNTNKNKYEAYMKK